MSAGEKSDENVVVICGFGNVGENVMNIVKSRLSLDSKYSNFRCVAFSLDPNLVVSGYKRGFDTLYGDGSEPDVLTTAGIDAANTKAFVVTYTDSELCMNAVQKLRCAYPNTPIISRSREFSFIDKIYAAGATAVITDEKETTLSLSQSLFESIGISDDINTAVILNQGDEEPTMASRILAYSSETEVTSIDKMDQLKRKIISDSEVLDQMVDIGNTNNTTELVEIDGTTTCTLPTRRQ